MKITADFLEDEGACAKQVRLFKRTFPQGANLTRRSFWKAVRAGLTVEWLGRGLKPRAFARYNRVDNVAWKKYDRAERVAITKCLHAKNSERAKAWREYRRAESVARAKCTRTTQEALLSLLLNPKNWERMP